jgi:hypothetical protein
MSKQPRRLIEQMQQEDISRFQFEERLSKFGWQTSKPQRDLGEDMQVQIYFDGQATGVTFHTQLKSVTDLEKRKKKRSNFLPYPFKVKDLIHWARFDRASAR